MSAETNAEVDEEETPEDAESEEQEQTNPLDDEELLREEYHENDLTQSEIGEKYGGVTASTVSHYMKKHGIETRNYAEMDERLDDAEWLEAAYHGDEVRDGGASMQAIGDFLEPPCSDGTVMRRLHEAGIETRRQNEAEPDEFERTRSVSGIGKAKVEALKEAGFESDEDVAEASLEDLEGQHGWSEGLAAGVAEEFGIDVPDEEEQDDDEDDEQDEE